jgi:HAMP domain-containing protein
MPRYYSLKLKFMLTVGGFVGILIVVLFWLMQQQHEKAILAQVDRQASTLLQQVVITREWIAKHGGIFVRKQPGVASNPFLFPAEFRDMDGHSYVFRNPAMVTRELSELATSAGLYRFHLTSLKLVNPKNAPSIFEKEALQLFETAGYEKSRNGMAKIEAEGANRAYFRIVPLRVERSCLPCHQRQGYRVGDVRGGLSVSIPLAVTEQLISASRISFALAGFCIITLVLAVIYLLMQRIVLNPIAHLQQVATGLSAGRYEMRASLSTGDELESLAHSFNSMTGQIIGGYESAVRTLAAAIEARDPYTRGHIDRVAGYSVSIAREMGFPKERLSEIEMGAILHDIGKIGISDAILRNPARLNADEMEEMQSHPQKGVAIIADLQLLAPVVAAVLHHHESFDGTGYPKGLQGEDIPLISRILSVADTFDAMTTDRPYRKGLTLEEAREEIKSEAGKQFDPDVVTAFLRACGSGALCPQSHPIAESTAPAPFIDPSGF